MARDLVVRIVGDSSSLERSLKRSERAANDFNRTTTQSFRGVLAGSGAFRSLGRQIAFASGTFLGFAGSAALIKGTVDAASNLNESMNAVRVTFGRAAGNVEAFTRQADDFGLSMREANQLLVPLGASLQNYGLSAAQAAEQSIQLGKRAADMASVFNTDVSQALEAIQSALRGEADPIERFGVSMADAAVKAEAFRLGLARSASEVSAQDKTLARLSLIYQQTARFQGDFANTSGGLANQTRILRARFENLQAEVGQALLPALVDLTESLNDLVQNPVFRGALKTLTEQVAGLGQQFAAILDPIRDFAVGFIDFMIKIEHAISGVYGQLSRLPGALGGNRFRKMQDNVEEFIDKLEGWRDTLKGIGGASDSAVETVGAAIGKAAAGIAGGALPQVADREAAATDRAVKGFELPFRLRLAQARAELTQTIKDDLAVATEIREFVNRLLRSGKVKGDRLLGALSELASANDTLADAQRDHADAVKRGAEKQREAAKEAAQKIRDATDRARQQIGELFAPLPDSVLRAQRRAELGLPGPDPRDLVAGLRSQTAAFTANQRNLARLRRVGAPTGLITELEGRGLDVAPQVAALAGASRQIQRQFFAAFRRREEAARKAAERPININVRVFLDDRDITSRVITRAQRTARHQGKQRRGRHGGAAMGLA